MLDNFEQVCSTPPRTSRRSSPPSPGHGSSSPAAPRCASRASRNIRSTRSAWRRCPTVRRDEAARRARPGWEFRVAEGRRRRGRVHARRPAAARCRAGRRPGRPCPAAARSRPARRAPAAARLRPAQRPRSTTDPRGRHRLEPRPARPDCSGVLHDLAVFDGGFDLEQAEAVVDPGRSTCSISSSTLVDQSLVASRQSPMRAERASGSACSRRSAASRLERLAPRKDARAARVAPCTGATSPLPRPPRRTCRGPTSRRWLDRLTSTTPIFGRRCAGRSTPESGARQRFVAGLWRFWQQDGRLVDGDGARRCRTPHAWR